MESLVLVDSCVYITLAKRRLDPSVVLLEHLELEDIATCGMVRLEVIRGIALPKVRTHIESFFDVMQNVPTDNKLWEEACELGWKVTRKGNNMPAQDIIIAACALRVDAAVLTHDGHFDHIPGLRVVHPIDGLR
ncbi:MAG: PIN domain-containing protein [Chthoniobacteraceae bacterium]